MTAAASRFKRRMVKKRRLLKKDPAELTRWLMGRGVWWARDAVAISRRVVEGLGCIALRNIARDEILFVIPKAACLVSSRDQGDCQKGLARIVKSPGKWRPFVKSLGEANLPFLWSTPARRLLRGTELEEVVRIKRTRDHDMASAIVLSHLNPFFGSAIVPFSCLLNYGGRANTLFQEENGRVVGRARRFIAKGKELTQAYASSTAEFLYRYGFVPRETKIRSEDAVSVLTFDADTENSKVIDGLVSSLCLEPNPWDGLDHILTVELVGPKARGVEKLVATCLALQKSAVIETTEDSDLAAARLAAAFLDKRKQQDILIKIARKHGGDDRDPWPALLDFVGRHTDLTPARQSARKALVARKARLLPIEDGDDHYHKCAASLKQVELSIISKALDLLA